MNRLIGNFAKKNGYLMDLKNAEKIRKRCKKIGIVVIATGLAVFVSGFFGTGDFIPTWPAFVMMIMVGLPIFLVGIPILMHGLFEKFSYVMMLATPIPLIFLYAILIGIYTESGH